MKRSPYVGQPIRRVEDHRFLTGTGCYTDDIQEPDQAHGFVLRSPHAHARIVSIDVAAARALPGVITVLTNADISDGTLPIPTVVGFDPNSVAGPDGRVPPDPPWWALARDKVRLVGDPIAFVVAETIEQARDAAETIAVEYDTLPAIIDFDTAMDPSAPAIWEEHGSNVSFEWEQGDADAVERVFESAATVASIELENNRQIVAFMEPRGIVASYDAQADKYTLRAGGQSAHSMRTTLAITLKTDAENIHMQVPDTGGGFGARGTVYPEFVLSAFAAKLCGRTVKWTADRGESFLTDTQARDQRVVAELALDDEGNFLAIRARVIWRHGAYVPTRSLWVHISFMAPMLTGVYRIPEAHFSLTGLFSNTGPIHAFRGVGRAEAAYLIERLVDEAAVLSGLDRVALRRRNLIPAAQMPYRSAAGALYGRCEFETILDRALDASRWDDFDTRRTAARQAGKLRGIGLSMYIESTGGVPSEFSEVQVDPEGVVRAFMGTQSFGMGHETVFAQVLADELGIDMDRIEIVDGDTDRVARGAGSHGSRSIRIGGGALVKGARAMIDEGRKLAADFLEAAEQDIEFEDGEYVIRGTDRNVDLFALTRFAVEHGNAPLGAQAVFDTENHAYANGCHVCELEIDPDTGCISVVSHVLVTDVGRVINPLITDGQLHGGILQGMGQALMEHVVFDRDDGQPLSASFLDYCLPRADDAPCFEVGYNEVHCDDNPLGAKGAGEGPTTGCPPSVINAVVDALSARGVARLDMPATPLRVWTALERAGPMRRESS